MPVSGALAGQPPAAAAPHEAAVHPGDPSATTIADKVLFGGAHGYLHEPDGTGQPLGTTYAIGASVPVDGLPTVAQYLSPGADTAGYIAFSTERFGWVSRGRGGRRRGRRRRPPRRS